jgi:hypothetical protein
MTSTHYTVSRTFLYGDERYEKGEVVEAGDPIVKSHPDHFVPLVVKERASTAKVEKATAAPGEKR